MFLSLCAGLLIWIPSCFGAATLKGDYSEQRRPGPSDYYEITGVNPSEQPQTVVIRFDDTPKPDYANRVNEERTVLPGPFRLWVQPASLQTPRGRFLNLDQLHRFLVFSSGDLQFQKIILKSQASMENAFDFGPKDSPVFPGFQPVDASSNLITAGRPKAFIRKGLDSLIRDGVKGIERLEIPTANGMWQVRLWTEDVGEWESLPPLHERRIRINGQTVSQIRQSHQDWIKRRYLQGQRLNEVTPWKQFGQRRGGLINNIVEVKDQRLTIEFAGSNAQATTLSALLLEPLGQDQFSDIQQFRQQWFDQKWPVQKRCKRAEILPRELSVFAGTRLFVPALMRPADVEKPIQARFYGALNNFHRPAPNSTFLIQTARRFSAHAQSMRPGFLRLDIPPGTPAGTYQVADMTVHVLKTPAPKLDRSIGVYLEAAPHLKNEQEIRRQIGCDLDELKRMGFTAIAPPFENDLKTDYDFARSFGYRDILAYTPVKRDLQQVVALLAQGVLQDVIFSIADEPSNPGQARELRQASNLLQNATPFAKRAGHFNSPKDRQHLSDVDIALINSGFGVDQDQIEQVKDAGVQPWFYNMERVRLAAGFYLWRLGVDGYLQWHARMPTADPFDPTDGREDDVQMFYPAETVCSVDQEIDLSLIEMVRGLDDLRWLIWLEQQAKDHRKARHLLRQIRAEIPTSWAKAQAKTGPHWDRLIRRIQKLALRLQ